MRIFVCAVLLAGIWPAVPALAQDSGRPKLASALPQTETDGKLQITSEALADGEIPLDSTSYGNSLSPPLAWTEGPAGTKSYVILMEDADAVLSGHLISHWVAYNIPSTTTSLPFGVPQFPNVEKPKLQQGKNTQGVMGYLGPRPPSGVPPHHYHIQVFALDRTIDLPTGPTREAVLDAMNKHVKAKGDLVGTFAGPG